MSERTASIVVICGLILALLIPCEGKSQEYRTVAINADANMYERAQALRAVNELTSLGYPTRIVEANDNPDATLFFIRDSFGKFKQNELGRTMLGSIALVFVDRIQRGNFDLCGVIAHEAGHAAWNLPHMDRGIMVAEAGPDMRCKGQPRVTEKR